MDLFVENASEAKTSEEVLQDFEVYCSSWIWRAVECLVKAKDFKPSPKWIAERLNISVEAAVEALDGVERLNLIVRTSSGYAAKIDFNRIDDRQHTKSKLLANHSKLAPQIISKLTEDDAFTTHIVLASEATMQKFTVRLSELLRDLSNSAAANNLSDVVAIEVSIASLTKNSKRGSVQ